MKTYIVDSFTNEAFKGNPAGVCFPNKDLANDRMLSIAQELNLSETAFVRKLEAEQGYSIRYFSPIKEIPLCGHATLASAKVLFNSRDIQTLHFHTIGGLDLEVGLQGDGIEMKFPVYDTIPASVPKALLEAMGITEVNNVVYNKETNILLLEIASTTVLKNLQPNFNQMLEAHDSIDGVLVTAASQDDLYDFHSRHFWPWSGGNEDPVTGATHTFMTKYWSARLGKQKMKSLQASARTGTMNLELVDEKTLLIRSQAVIVLEGELLV